MADIVEHSINNGGQRIMHHSEFSDKCATCIAAEEARPKSGESEPAPQGAAPTPGVEASEVGAASGSDSPVFPLFNDFRDDPPASRGVLGDMFEGPAWDPPQDAGWPPSPRSIEDQRAIYEASKRTFETGATRDTDTDKLDYEGFLSPPTLLRYAEYMHKNRVMADGSLRSSDNWQKGIPPDVYMKSLLRHVMDVWTLHRSGTDAALEPLEESLCAVLFNTFGYLHELLKEA